MGAHVRKADLEPCQSHI